MRTLGTRAMGVRAPIIKEGDDLSQIVVDCIMAAVENDGVKLNDRDVIGITEAVVARAQGNYATTADVAACVRSLFKEGPVGVVFPITSRNRFATLLKGIAMGADKLIVQLSYPADEVGNALIDAELVYDAGLNPYSDALTADEFHARFGAEVKHRFTGIDYINYYKSLGDNIEIVLSNDPAYILNYTKNVIAADIHTRRNTRRTLENAGAAKVVTLDEILSSPVNGSGYNDKYGILGSNKASDDRIKLFPRDCEAFALSVQNKLLALTGKTIEVMVYGDGGFKDPVGGIWELADPVVSPGYTSGLVGTPNELKLKYLADTRFAGLSGAELEEAMRQAIREKDNNLVGSMETQGTTPRQLTDLLGSLCDLMSGSGDKGTPIVLIQGYFDNYAD